MVGLVPAEYSLHPQTKKGNGISVNLPLLKRACVRAWGKEGSSGICPSLASPTTSILGATITLGYRSTHTMWWAGLAGSPSGESPAAGKPARSLVQLHLKDMFFQLEMGRKGVGLWGCPRELPILQGTVLGAADIEVNKRDRVGPSQSVLYRGTEEADLNREAIILSAVASARKKGKPSFPPPPCPFSSSVSYSVILA